MNDRMVENFLIIIIVNIDVTKFSEINGLIARLTKFQKLVSCLELSMLGIFYFTRKIKIKNLKREYYDVVLK